MKKIISITLCICLVSSVFISCAKDDARNSATVYDTIIYSYDGAYSYDDATVRAYQELCDAVVYGRNEIRINSGLIDNVMQLFYTSFPLSILVENIQPTENGAYSIKYKNEKTLHDDVYNFIEQVNEIRGKCNSYNKTVYAINLYNYIASTIKISQDTSISCFETVMKGEGTSFSYSNMFEYLLQQKGIKAYHILCEDMGGVSKGISAAELGGNLYYFDLMSEYYTNGGKKLIYFGMTSEDVKNIGLTNLIYTNRETAEDASDLKFEACRYSNFWELDEDKLLITRNDGEIVQIAL